ncbi:hypothetical protein C4D60_Mb03t12920 [Musa balbisiana]|uniref:Uncharacterized protein n=1 Tax=Musa balbisiana TaxID=52838 RepID=A0A4V4H634_MUSBA|nr:hypothetical protein C4D60_Mb03t12920 [Musa balbisiana]
MRAVTGTVISSKRISLSKASAVVSRFAANQNAARPEVAAYVRRTSAAFDELVRFHREIRAARKGSDIEKPIAKWEAEEELKKNKSRKRSRDEPEFVNDGTLRVEGYKEVEDGGRDRRGGGVGSDGGGEKKKRRKKADEERGYIAIKDEKVPVSNGNLVEPGRDYGDGAELRKDGKRRKKKMKVDVGETSSPGRKVKQEPELEEERRQHRKKKEKENRKGDQKEEIPAGVVDRKHRKSLDVGEDLGDLKDGRYKKKKKKNRPED